MDPNDVGAPSFRAFAKGWDEELLTVCHPERSARQTFPIRLFCGSGGHAVEEPALSLSKGSAVLLRERRPLSVAVDSEVKWGMP